MGATPYSGQQPRTHLEGHIGVVVVVVAAAAAAAVVVVLG